MAKPRTMYIEAARKAVQEDSGAGASAGTAKVPDGMRAIITNVGINAPPGAWNYLMVQVQVNGRPVWGRTQTPTGTTQRPTPLHIEVGGGQVIDFRLGNDGGQYPYNSYVYVDAILEYMIVPDAGKEAEAGKSYGVGEDY